ncbi:MAG TPA: AI-2E family transporter [Rubricoccaceae bacterium]|nr:AI-2E family transporter [Rubricoccaceae bacterium]
MATRIPWLKTALALAAAAALVALVVVGWDLLVLVVVATVLAYLLFPLVNALERRGLGRTAAASAVFFGLSLLLGLAAWLTLPAVARQAAAWQERWAEGRLYDLLDRLEADLAAAVPFIEPGALGLSAVARQTAADLEHHALGYATDALSLVGDLVVIPFVLFFLLRDGVALQKRLVALVPNRYFEFTMGVLYKIDAHLGGYLRGQFLIALIVGLLTTLGLGLLGVEYYLVLGIFTGVANFIPYVGFAISAALTLGVSVVTTGGVGQVLGVIVVFAVVQTFENAVLQPMITARNVSLHPVTVLLAILLGGRLAGVLGMALAVPAYAIAKAVVVETAVNLRRYRL